MRFGRLAAAPFLVLALAVFVFLPLVSSGQYANSSISNQINATVAYVSMVNKSAYIIFYPNLSGAYYYINKAKNLSASNPKEAEVMLEKAHDSAAQQLYAIYRYRSEAVAALALIALILAIILYLFAKPINQKTTKIRQ